MKRSAALGGPVAAAAGIFADVITPIASAGPLTLAITSLILLLVFTYLWHFKHHPKLKRERDEQKISPAEFEERCHSSFSARAFALFAITTPMFSLFLILPQDDDRGVVATYVPGIAELQESLFRIEKGVNELKASNKAIKGDTTEILENVSNINRGIEALGDLGGLVANPQTPEDFYHNARIHELGGDYGNARQAYLKFFSFGLDKLDPYLTFTDMLKIQEGFAGARGTFELLAQRHQNVSSKLALALLMDGDARKNKLTALSEAHADFGPVWFYIAEQFSEKTLGTQGSQDKKREFEALSQFLSMDKSGKVMRYYLDQEKYQEVMKAARGQHKILSMINFDELDSPIRAKVSIEANATPMIRFITLEKAKKIMFRWEDDMEYVDTGLGKMNELGWREARKEMGFRWQEMPWTSFNVSIKFVDALGRDQGPFSVKVDPLAGAEIDVRDELTHLRAKIDQVTGDDGSNQTLVNLDTLAMNSYLIRGLRYSYGTASLDQQIDFHEAEKAWRAEVSGKGIEYFENYQGWGKYNLIPPDGKHGPFHYQLILINGKRLDPMKIDF